ncbi:MAG: alkaline phosphatase family protein [Anaerolineales bacterium]|nr:alkaline phosphatase family protein [Anaerolineales bacterium]
MTTNRVAVFGLDGITFDLLQPWIDQGLLPNLASLIKNGASGRLRTTIPPVSASAWASFFTGANPGKHGLIDFTYPARHGYEIRVSNSQTCAAPPIWDLIGQAGKSVGVISMPMTFPPKPVNGYMLTSFLTPSPESDYTFPSSLKEEIHEKFGPYPLHMSEKGRGKDSSIFVSAVKNMEMTRAQTVKYLLETRPTDFFVYVVETTDNLQHEVWHLLDETHPRYDPIQAKAILPKILDYYQNVDRMVGEMVDILPKETLIVVMSDHGFGPFHKFFHVNNWLVKQGWLKFKRTPIGLVKRLIFKLGGTPINALKWVTLLNLGKLRKNVKRGRGRGMLRRLFLSFDDVDWSRTKAFSVGNFGQIYLNVQGVRPQGLVPPGEYDVLREEIAQAAMALRDPVDGSQVVMQVYRREELFDGSRSDRMPDLILHTDRAKYVSFGHADFGSNRILEPSTGQTGHHHMTGVLVMKGPQVKESVKLDESCILDLAPTIMHYLGLKVPAYMDGRVLKEAFTDDFIASNNVRIDQSSMDDNQNPDSISSDDAEMVLQRLKDLGYVA